MKIFLNLILSISIAVAASGQNNINKLKVTAKLDTAYNIAAYNQYNISTTVSIYNDSEDTIRYYHDICETPFKCDNEQITIRMVGCDTNGSVTVIIPPHQSTKERVHLHTILSQLKSKQFRIGFIFYTQKQCA